MKKLLLVSTALVGVAMMSTQASAAVKLDLGGFFRGYGVYTDNNEPSGTTNNLNEFEFRRETELYVTGETTLDNGLTFGVATEAKIANGANSILADETYAYASGGWGRFNLGTEDGAAYLLQVSAPSADSNVDGMRVNIQALNPAANYLTGNGAPTAGTPFGATNTASPNVFNTNVLKYAQEDFRNAERLTYLTPKFNGFQGAASYAPKTGFTSKKSGMSTSDNSLGRVDTVLGNTAADYTDLWEVAARWDGEFQGFGIDLGAGYSSSENAGDPTNAQVLALATQGYYLNEGIDSYNFGANFSVGGFSLGGSYLNSETSRIAETVNGISTGTGDIERETWVVGLGYDNGPYHLGASYLNQQTDYAAIGTGLGQAIAATSYEADRFTVGGGYTFGPGMTFRGAVAWGEFDSPGTGNTNDNKFTQITVGTDVKF